MSEVRHKIVLSTTEPNSDIGLLKIRQADEKTQILEVQIIENGTPKSFDSLQVFFCAKLGQTNGLGIVEQKLKDYEMTSPSAGKFEYTFRPADWQQIGNQVGYFSFRTMSGTYEYVEQFSTRDFEFVVTKNVFSNGVKEVKKDGSTYIWTFEDLLRLFDQFINNAENKILDYHKQWENFLEENKELVNQVDPNGEVLTELINSRGKYKSLSERLEKENNEFSIDPSAEFGGEIPRNVFLENIDEMKVKIPDQTFNLQLVTDTHYDERANRQYQNGNVTMSHITNALAFEDKVDAIVVNGDNIDAVYSSLDRIKLETKDLASKLFDRDSKADIFINLGNHDDGSGRPPYKDWKLDSFIRDAEYRDYYRTTQLLNDEVRDNGSLYFYKDYPEKKIRLIMLNTSDIDELKTDENGNLKYPRWNTIVIRQRQLDWFANTALKRIPEDYHTLIVAHSPLAYGWSDGHAVMPNHEFVKNTIKAFKTGSTYSEKSEELDFPLLANYDFTEQGPRNFIGFFAGHTHKEAFVDWDGIQIVHCLHSVDDATNNNSGTSKEDAQTTICVDIEKRKVDLFGLGRATRRSFSY